MNRNFTNDFSLAHGHVWLNAAGEGPLPTASAHALTEAIQWKLSPHLLTIPKFQHVPLELKHSIAQLLGTKPDDIILGNSATYGIHLLANGIVFNQKDEVLVMQNDFPTDILPWLSLEQHGVRIIQLKPKGHVPTPDDIKGALTSRTKVVCMPHVHSFSGWALKIKEIGELCRSKNIIFIVNLSQTAGAFPVDDVASYCDAIVSAGYKWLLGPYGTGFCWMTKTLREALDYPQNYWISLMDEESLATEGPLTLKNDHSSRRYDIFGTANFFNYVPWRSSIEYLLKVGLSNVKEHNTNLVNTFINALDSNTFTFLSPTEKNERTNIIVFSHRNAAKNPKILEHLKNNGYHLTSWKGKLRASPHIYNTVEQINNLTTLLNSYGA